MAQGNLKGALQIFEFLWSISYFVWFAWWEGEKEMQQAPFLLQLHDDQVLSGIWLQHNLILCNKKSLLILFSWIVFKNLRLMMQSRQYD